MSAGKERHEPRGGSQQWSFIDDCQIARLRQSIGRAVKPAFDVGLARAPSGAAGAGGSARTSHRRSRSLRLLVDGAARLLRRRPTHSREQHIQRATVHQVAFDLVTENHIPGTHEAPDYSFVRVRGDEIVIHQRSYLYDGPFYSLHDHAAQAAQSPADIGA